MRINQHCLSLSVKTSWKLPETKVDGIFCLSSSKDYREGEPYIAFYLAAVGRDNDVFPPVANGTRKSTQMTVLPLGVDYNYPPFSHRHGKYHTVCRYSCQMKIISI